jgi:Cys-tRNA(Pro)/Cys-tRNA(Cys) deacylase
MSRPNSVRRLERAGISHRLHAVGESVATGEAMAEALGVEPAQVLRTLVCEVERPPRSGAGPTRRTKVLALVAADRTLDLVRLARAADGVRARLATHVEAERWTGLLRGGISPLAVPEGRFEVLIDARAARIDPVHVSAGVRGQELELAAQDLARAVDGRFAELS